MNEKLIAEALKTSFMHAIAKGAGEPFDALGVAMPSDKIWDRYARDVAAALTPNPAVNVGALVTDEMLNNMLLSRAPNRRWTLASLLKECDVGRADRLAYMRAALEAALTSPQGEETPAAPSPQADVRVIAGVTVDVLLDQCERLAEPIRASTKSFQYASALDNCVAVIKALRGAVTEAQECSACGGTGRMGPYFPGGLSTICGNCRSPSPQPNVVPFSEGPITDEEQYLIGKASQALYRRCEQSRGKPEGKQISAEHDAMMRLRRRHQEVEAVLAATQGSTELSAIAVENGVRWPGDPEPQPRAETKS